MEETQNLIDQSQWEVELEDEDVEGCKVFYDEDGECMLITDADMDTICVLTFDEDDVATISRLSYGRGVRVCYNTKSITITSDESEEDDFDDELLEEVFEEDLD
ncbi:MAG: hypothetical protein ACRC5C_08545 [Bacilli bacterium]